jgi:hypothetical protein
MHSHQLGAHYSEALSGPLAAPRGAAQRCRHVGFEVTTFTSPLRKCSIASQMWGKVGRRE